MADNPIVQKLTGTAALEVNRVLRNTYLLLSLTLLFSGGIAWYAMVSNAAPIGIVMFILGAFGLQFLTVKLSNSGLGLLAIFAFTGFMGYTIGPILNAYIHAFSNGGQLVMTALGATGLVFFGLSLHAISSRKNYSYMGGFIAAASIIVVIMLIGAIAFNIPMLVLIISGAFCVISSAFILYTTSNIIHGGERNYIVATVSLYVSIFNLFLSLLRILSFFAGNRN